MATQPTIEQEIIQLEQQLAEKRAALGKEQSLDTVQGKEVELSDKEILHEIVGERLQQAIPQYRPPAVQVPPPTFQASKDDSDLNSVLLVFKDKVQELINTVFNKSLAEGIKQASKSNNSALIDAFHDVLVDELYNVLVERRKLEEVK